MQPAACAPSKDTASPSGQRAEGSRTELAAAGVEGSSRPRWRVVGGGSQGGIVVRIGKEYDSSKAESRLATGAVVEELEAHGERLCYRLLEGTGPPSGWVSKTLKGKELLVPAGEALETKEGGRGLGRLLRLQVVRAFEEALELSWRVFLDGPSDATQGAGAAAQGAGARGREAPATRQASKEAPPRPPSKPLDPSGPHLAFVELVLDHAHGKRQRHEPLRPQQDAFVKRVDCNSDIDAMIHNMPSGRHLLISVVVRFQGEGRLRSKWLSVTTRTPKDRPVRVTNVDPRGEERGRGPGYGCDGFVVARTRINDKVATRVRCLRCGCDYNQHELASQVPPDVNLVDVRREGRSAVQQVMDAGSPYQDSDTDDSDDNAFELPMQVLAVPQSPLLLDAGAANSHLVPIEMKQRKAVVVLSPKEMRPRFTLIFLHGFNEAAETWEAKEFFWPLVEQGVRVVLPNAPCGPITAYEGRRFPAWYDYLTDQNGSVEDMVDGVTLRRTRGQLSALIDKEAARFEDQGHRRVLVGGSSQGCCAAFDAYARHHQRLGGFVGLVGHPLAVTPLTDSLQNLDPCFFFNGADDTYARWSWVEPAIRRLVKVGWKAVKVQAAEGVGHGPGEAYEEAWINEFLDQFLNSSTPP